MAKTKTARRSRQTGAGRSKKSKAKNPGRGMYGPGWGRRRFRRGPIGRRRTHAQVLHHFAGTVSAWDTLARWQQRCIPPLSANCQRLQVTSSWAVTCFMRRFYELKALIGPDLQGITQDLMLLETPHCHIQPTTPAEFELHRRIELAVAVLLVNEGYDVGIHLTSAQPRPRGADSIRQPWLRALLTGWL